MSSKKTGLKAKPKITFTKPPLTEVVFGIQFEMLPKFVVGHVGKLWQRFEGDYTVCREQPALVAQVEPLPNAPNTIQVLPTLMPRTVLATSDNSSIVQIQRDAFYYNWQKVSSKVKYPRYEQIAKKFQLQFDKFTDFISEQGLGEIKPFQFELTYLNEIPLDTQGLRLLKDACWDVSVPRLFAQPESINLQSSFLFPDGTGRLHSTFRTITKSDGEMVYHWAFVARGTVIPRSEMALDKVRPWLDNANNLIANAFVDMSTEEAQKKLWERTS